MPWLWHMLYLSPHRIDIARLIKMKSLSKARGTQTVQFTLARIWQNTWHMVPISCGIEEFYL
jgi:hypothetical protein